MDVMALAPDSDFVNMSESGPTESAYDVLLDEDGEFNNLRPSILEFTDHFEDLARQPGFFFNPTERVFTRLNLTLKRIDQQFATTPMI